VVAAVSQVKLLKAGDANGLGDTPFHASVLVPRHKSPLHSGSPQEQLPSDLRSAPFIPKPFYPAQN